MYNKEFKLSHPPLLNCSDFIQNLYIHVLFFCKRGVIFYKLVLNVIVKEKVFDSCS